MAYYRHGEYHRIVGPAYIERAGIFSWDQYGKIHRKDGYAVIWPDGYDEYWIRGIKQC
jgi:hypothetical protein